MRERRKLFRTKVVLPVEIPLNNMLGEAINISEAGVCLKTREDIALKPTVILLNSTTPVLLKLEMEALWRQVSDGDIYLGARFLNFKEEDRGILKEGLLRYEFLDPNFINLIVETKYFLQKVKAGFDEADKARSNEHQRIRFLEENKAQVSSEVNKRFGKIGKITRDLDKKSYDIYQHYFHQMLEPLLGRGIEINDHIYKKPLGYPGDYMVQNYILDYHKGRYLGHTTYQKLINHYTCNIPISRSNVRRKDFFKSKVLELLERKDCTRILSVASGPVRELIELTREGKIVKPLIFKCIDFEERTLCYIKNEIEKIDEKKRQLLKIEYIRKNIPALIRDKKLKEEVGKHDMIYSSGLFDYLTDGLASRFIQLLYGLLSKDGTLIICNASLKNDGLRAYYELLGNWVFYHRTKEQLLEWVKDIKTAQEITFEQPHGGESYLYMLLKRG